MSQVPPILDPKEDDIQKMLASDVHIGTANLDTQMAKYIWKRRSDGLFFFPPIFFVFFGTHAEERCAHHQPRQDLG